MSIKTRGLITLTVEKEITEIRNFYKATSTNVAPSIPTTGDLKNIATWTNADWSTTEPAFNISTPYVWICMQSLYGTYDEDHTAVSLSSSYTAAVDTRILTNNISSRTVDVWTNYNEITDTEDSSITIPAGMYIFSNPSVNYTKTSTYDHNLYLNSTGLFLRYKTANLARYNIDGVHLYAATNGIQYRRSTDTTVVASKTYFTISGTHFVKVANPSGNPVTNGYYEASTTSLQTNPLIELTYDIVESGVTPTLKNRLTFYDPDTSYRAMELTNNELAFYNINSSNDKVASLSTSGLEIIEGSIKLGSIDFDENNNVSGAGFYVNNNGELFIGDAEHYISLKNLGTQETPNWKISLISDEIYFGNNQKVFNLLEDGLTGLSNQINGQQVYAYSTQNKWSYTFEYTDSNNQTTLQTIYLLSDIIPLTTTNTGTNYERSFQVGFNLTSEITSYHDTLANFQNFYEDSMLTTILSNNLNDDIIAYPLFLYTQIENNDIVEYICTEDFIVYGQNYTPYCLTYNGYIVPRVVEGQSIVDTDCQIVGEPDKAEYQKLYITTTYVQTTDTVVVSDTDYYIFNNIDNTYTLVQDDDKIGNPSEQGWFVNNPDALLFTNFVTETTENPVYIEHTVTDYFNNTMHNINDDNIINFTIENLLSPIDHTENEPYLTNNLVELPNIVNVTKTDASISYLSSLRVYMDSAKLALQNGNEDIAYIIQEDNNDNNDALNLYNLNVHTQIYLGDLIIQNNNGGLIVRRNT